MQSVLAWMRHRFNLYLIKKVIHSCIQQSQYLLNVSYTLNWVLLGEVVGMGRGSESIIKCMPDTLFIIFLEEYVYTPEKLSK